ncbi:Holliday junction branch migration protein RuvA [Orrella marina]|uniref:Holliday junction branch migration complex subunit RuvA n=1 Tax=Orrella marina TaxID=2163011 RepID=A0A2R4XNK9_9BURK|nr:Holliday junction branch migration protein RuvA [Orrella marina]AWB35354.1 Holliday junction branch migration protein RuvA [Orrella marina]
MIGRLTGKLYEKSPPRVGLDVHGVGYEIDVSMATFYNLPDLGAEVTLLIHHVVREDAQLLYGFASPQERAAFRELIKVTGIGARIALAVLSGLSVDDLAHAISTQETARLVRVPGIGKKTAERLLLEMKGKLGADLTLGTQAFVSNHADILAALTALGYSEKECAAAVKSLPEGVEVSEGIRLALKHLAR